ncbi:MAG TPA: Ig-like domain-containing protein [Thermoanaerobaculia bacterium]
MTRDRCGANLLPLVLLVLFLAQPSRVLAHSPDLLHLPAEEEGGGTIKAATKAEILAAFAVIYTRPAEGDTEVSVNNQPEVRFNRAPVAGPGMSGITLTDEEDMPVPFNPVLRASENRLVIVTGSSLSPGVTYTLSVPQDAVLDETGAPLAGPVLFSFTAALAGTPRMYLTAYPKYLMEGSRTRVSVWFEKPAPVDRTVTLTQTPPGELTGLSEIFIPAGQVLGEVELRARLNHSSTDDVYVTLAASEPAAGQRSFIIEVKNDTSVTGTSLRYLAAGVTSETDGDGIFESNEHAEILFEVANFGSQMVCNVILTFRVLNTRNMSILGGAPFQCIIGCLGAGRAGSCDRSFGADENLPTGDYFIEVTGTSTVNSFLDQQRIQVVNRAQPDFLLNVGTTLSNPRPPGTIYNLQITPRNTGDGFAASPPLPAPGLPYFRVLMDVQGQTQVLYDRVYAEVRGDVNHSQDFSLPIVYPPTPGTHAIRAVVDPDGLIGESNEGNNEAPVRFITVSEPNQAPVLAPIGGPWTVNVGAQLCLNLSASDPNGHALSFSFSPALTGTSLVPLSPSSARFCWTTSSNQGPAVHSLAFTVTDNGTPPLSDSETVIIEVPGSNLPVLIFEDDFETGDTSRWLPPPS